MNAALAQAARDRRRRGRPFGLSASPAAISPASCSAGASSIGRARRRRVEDMERLIAWLGEQGPGRRRPRRAGARRLADRQHDLRRRRADDCSRCSTGSCRRSAIPSPTSPTSACSGGCRTPGRSAGSAASTARRAGIPTEDEYVAAYCRRAGLDRMPDWTFLIAFSFFRGRGDRPGRLQALARRQRLEPGAGAAMGAAVPLMAKLAMEEVEAGRLKLARASPKAKPPCRRRASRAKRHADLAARYFARRRGPGEVAEWSIAPHSKCGVRASVPGVRIPPSPPRFNVELRNIG